MSPQLKRSLSLTLLTLYGIGTMVGAGIYVLIGETTALAGKHTPLSYLLAAVIVIPTALSFAELSSRYPKSAGEAAYMRAGFHSSLLALIVGLMVVAAGTISAASITVGSVGYLQTFFPNLPETFAVFLVVCLLGVMSAWGISQSVWLAALLSIIEVGGLLMIIAGGIPDVMAQSDNFDSYFLPQEFSAFAAILSASMLAFYAFIGFEDMVNIAEEVKQPQRNLPLAILLALGITTSLYLSVALVAITAVPAEVLGASSAPLGLVFEQTTTLPKEILNAIGIMAALNGILIQIIMAPRILYGLSCQHSLPKLLSRIHPKTRTPVIATLLVTVAVLLLALAFPIDKLARWTALVALTVFTLCNLALIRIKMTQPAQAGIFTTPMITPVLGALTSAGFLLQEILQQLL